MAQGMFGGGGGGGGALQSLMGITMMQQFQTQQQQIQQATKVAQQNQATAVQSNVSSDTWDMLRQFGQVGAWNTAAGTPQGVATPMSTTAGGFSSAPVTASGAPSGGGK